MKTIAETIEKATSEGNFENFAIDPQSIKATSEYCKDFLLIEKCLFGTISHLLHCFCNAKY